MGEREARPHGNADPESGHSRRAFPATKKICGTTSISDKLVRRPDAAPMWPARTRRQTMRVMVLVKATDDSEKGFLPTPEELATPREGERGKLGVA